MTVNIRDALAGVPQDSDKGNGQRMVMRHGQDMLYCKPMGGWLVWDGKRWSKDQTGQIERFAKETVASIYQDAADASDSSERARLARHALNSESVPRIKGMIESARTEPGIMVTADAFDSDPWLLNVANGTLDLRTFTLKDHDPADMITKLVPVDYDPNAQSDVLSRYLATVTQGDLDLCRYLQRACGYSLTGDTREECFFLMLGPGGSGKSTLVEAMLAMLGDYGVKSNFNAFLHSRNIDPNGPMTGVVRLQGARFVAAVEANAGSRLNESLVKELSGRDQVTARGAYAKDETTYEPQFKLWLAANNSPTLTDTDSGIWRRIKRLPFERELTEDEKDDQLKPKLKTTERAALLAWAVAGCRDWQRQGLGTCDIVALRTAELRAAFDPLAEFFGGYCVFERDAETPAKDLRDAYVAWAASMGARPLNNSEWSKRLKEKGAVSRRVRRSGKQVTVWFYVGLLADDLPQPLSAMDVLDQQLAQRVQHKQNKPRFQGNNHNPPHVETLGKKGGSPARPARLDLPKDYSGPAIWQNEDHDQPVTVVGYKANSCGRSYFEVKESATCLPGDELIPLAEAV